MKTREIVTMGILSAILLAAQVSLGFLPNIELVTLLLIVYTYDKSGFQGSKGAKPHRAFVKKCSAEGGTLILCSLAREGRVGYNIGLDELLLDLLEQEG